MAYVQVIGEAGVPGVDPGRRCSLADLTVIRHARRESVQLLEAAGRTVPRMTAEHGPRRNSYIGKLRKLEVSFGASRGRRN